MPRLVALILACPSSAWACAVCGGGTALNDRAYYEMTFFMSALPLSIIGGMVALVAWKSGFIGGAGLPDRSTARSPDPSEAPGSRHG